jgi:hypothetical protein
MDELFPEANLAVNSMYLYHSLNPLSYREKNISMIVVIGF